MTKAGLVGVFMAFLMISCGGETKQIEADMEANTNTVKPIHSFAQPQVAVVKHLFLEVAVSFENKEVAGWVHYDIKTAQGAEKIVLDAKNLNIAKVMIDSVETKDWWLGEEKPFLGQALEIAISDSTKTVSVKYSSVNSDAIFWLDNGDKPPFMFTQSQAILARTWLPCQDSPGIRYTYNARVTVDKGLMALMSATNPTEVDSSGIYEFEMTQPIPSYLMALAVGDVRYEKLGANTGVYALPEVLDTAAFEFEDMQKMLESAEKLYGKYAWEQYDVLVLPASFPFGGMENPRLTFATPTILAGDKSLTSLVAHELAHSWSGNLVTNATWNDFWLNEGFTVYFERRIMEDIYGKDYADMLAVLGRQDLSHTMHDLADHPEDTQLKLNLEGRDPDDGMTDIAYEKGYFFLRTIEKEVGRQSLDAFLNRHFSENAFKTITTEVFLKNLKAQLLDGDQAKYDALKIDEWVYQPGIPSNCMEVSSVLFEQVQAQVDSFNNDMAVSKIDTAGWTTHQWLYFLRNMPDSVAFDRLGELDKTFGFTKTGNSEIAAEWFVIAINNNYRYADEAIKKFLLRVGRRKFLIPLYNALIDADPSLERARSIYAEAKSNYHSVATNTIDQMLKALNPSLMNIDKPETTDFTPLSFRDFSTAFAHLSDKELRFSHRIFSLMNNEKLTSFATSLGELALKWNLPVGWAAKPTIFKVFCGGETIYESLKAVEKLGINNIGAILDYSVEGQEKDHEFGKTELEIVRIIQMASENSSIPVACIKVSGIASNVLLEKLSAGKDLDDKDKRDAAALHQRFERICQAAFDNNVPLYVDAEESWLQVAIDRLVESMMVRYNKERAIIFQTIQMFRHDRLSYFSKLIERGRREGFKIGVKIVRGAYLDKENNRAIAKGYPTPIQPNKQATDDAYNAALRLSVENIDWVEICAGTHNEESSIYLTELMHEHNLPNNHPHIYFSQLYGMSDYMSFNLAASGYNVSKYLPYGPVKATLPYLIRRAKENSAIAGQMSKEFTMISNELKRRRQQTFEV